MSQPVSGDPGVAFDPESEPLIARAAGAAVMMVLSDALIALGVHMSPAATTLAASAVNLLILAGLAYLVRRRVFSPATVASIILAARRSATILAEEPAAPASSPSTESTGPAAG